MNLEDILIRGRQDLDDEIGSDSQRNWSDEELTSYANDAVIEIIKELSCLTEDDNFDETVATGSITLSGTNGGIAQISINGAVITSAAVPFDVDLSTTASDLAANINAFAVNPLNSNAIKYTAQAVAAVVTISSPVGTGSTPNGYTILPTFTGNMSSVLTTTFSGGACMCKLFLIPGQSRYQMHPKIIKILRFKPSLRSRPLSPMTKKQLDNDRPGWEDEPAGMPWTYVPDYKKKKVIVVSIPSDADTVYLDVSRMPENTLTVTALSGVPEIPEDYHDCISPWMKRQAFLKADRECLNVNKSLTFDAEFKRKIEQAKTKLDIPQQPFARGFAPQGMY